MSRVYKRGGSPYWQAEFYDLSGQRHQRSTQCTDRRAAEARLRELERDAADPARAAARTTTVRDILEAFVTQRHQDARAGRASAETSTFYAKKAGHVVRVFGEGTPVAELNAARVDAFIAQRRTEGAADSTIHKELVTLIQGEERHTRARCHDSVRTGPSLTGLPQAPADPGATPAGSAAAPSTHRKPRAGWPRGGGVAGTSVRRVGRGRRRRAVRRRGERHRRTQGVCAGGGAGGVRYSPADHWSVARRSVVVPHVGHGARHGAM